MLNPLIIESTIRQALLEDLGHGRDITSETIIPASKTARAVLRAREPGILAGLAAALSAFALTDSECAFDVQAQDGDLLTQGGVIAAIDGPARAILSAERVALNFIQHLSGIATMTGLFVDEVAGTAARITCTRKTLPNLRYMQKYAVRVGGGSNHRSGLDDMILIKDNHIAVAGGVAAALDACRAGLSQALKIEIEVDTLEQLQEVLSHGGADIVLLDNMDVKTLSQAVKMAKGQIITEASGGVNLKTVRGIAETGVDYISIGALTHSVRALDIGLDFEIA